MLVFSHSRISTRLFIQAALTALLAPTAAHGQGWLAVTMVVAAAAVGVALVVRTNPPNMRLLVVGFEAAALGVGLVGMAEGHYIPGTVVGVITLITVLSGQPQVATAGTWAPPVAPPPPGAWAPPVAPPPPGADNPYASPMPVVPVQPAGDGEMPVTGAGNPAPVSELPAVPRSMNILPGQ